MKSRRANLLTVWRAQVSGWVRSGNSLIEQRISALPPRADMPTIVLQHRGWRRDRARRRGVSNGDVKRARRSRSLSPFFVLLPLPALRGERVGVRGASTNSDVATRGETPSPRPSPPEEGGEGAPAPCISPARRAAAHDRAFDQREQVVDDEAEQPHQHEQRIDLARLVIALRHDHDRADARQ
jgi:hypothetical protein